MGLANCLDCGKVFVKNTQDKVCPTCLKIRRDELHKISCWLETSTKPVLNNIEAEIGITEENFIKYLLDGRIINFGKVYCDCEVCGAETRIKSKKFICQSCSDSLKKPSAISIPKAPKKALEETKLYSKRKDNE